MWIKAYQGLKRVYLPTEADKQWLASYLSRSPVDAVCLNADLGEASLIAWADACHIARKPVFLRLPSEKKLLPSRKGLRIRVRQGIEWLAAAMTLFLLSPLMLALIFFIRYQRQEPALCREWCVGDKGRIFQTLTFNINLPRVIKHSPNLINILRGNIRSLKGEFHSLHTLLCS